MKDIKRYTITSALPYANGPVHIGHLAGVYVPADIYVRYLRNNGKEVLFIGGSDEHGVPITIKARKEGVTPQDHVFFVQKFHRYHTVCPNQFQPKCRPYYEPDDEEKNVLQIQKLFHHHFV